MPPIAKPTLVPAALPTAPPPPALPKPAKAPRRPLGMAPDVQAWSPQARQAHAEAARIWAWNGPAEVSDGPFNRIERDPRDANATTTMDAIYDATSETARQRPAPAKGPNRAQLAAAQVAKHAAAENAVFLADDKAAGWDSIREMRYGNVKELIAEDPIAQLAWQTLLLTGRLGRNAEPALDGRPLFDQVVGLLKAPLAPGLDRATLVADLVQELAEPACIAQKYRSTCTVTSMQIMLAADRPAEYARLVAGLATTGMVRTAGGALLIRDDVDPGRSGRTQSAALFQAACMEYGNGDHDYKDATDESGPAGTLIKQPSRGLGPEQVTKVLDGVLGGTWTYQEADTTGQGGLMAFGSSKGKRKPEEVMASMAAIVRRGRPVVAAVTFADDMKDVRAALSGHAILVTDARDGRIYYRNPHGAEESMTEADFASRLRGFHAEAGDAPPMRP